MLKKIVKTCKLLRQLDWKTSFMLCKLEVHWRIWLLILICGVTSVAIWGVIFPNTFWFLKFWAGMTSGTPIGVLIGLYWQMQDSQRVNTTNGRFCMFALFGWGSLGFFSLCILGPQLHSEELYRRQFRNLIDNPPEMVCVEYHGDRNHINNKVQINQFCSLSKNAYLFYPSHDGSLDYLRLHFIYADGIYQSFAARISKHYPGDLSVVFKGSFSFGELLIPQGAGWVKSLKITDYNEEKHVGK